MQDETRVWREPATDFGGLVAGGVVEHEVHVEVPGTFVDRLEELQELDGAVARVEGADHLAARMFSAAYRLVVPLRS